MSLSNQFNNNIITQYIRTYQPNDYPKIAEILKAENMLDVDWDSKENFDAISAQNKTNILVSENKGEITGCVVFLPFGKTAALGYQLIVKKEYRKQGIASALLDSMQKELKKIGITKIALETYADDNYLIKFYSKKEFMKGSKPRIVFWKSI